MERATPDHFGRSSLREEHFHRYQLARQMAYGCVVDCACGIGYGSEIITSSADVLSYLGLDPSEEAVSFAIGHYASSKARFELGTLENNSIAKATIDTFLVFETLEHTRRPELALENMARCLKPDGLLIGSVPSAEYESLCEAVYGTNPFHLQRFTKDHLDDLLNQFFGAVRLYSMEYVLGSLVQALNETDSALLETVHRTAHQEKFIAGSLVFIAGSPESVTQATHRLGSANKFFPGIAKALVDQEEIEPLRATIHSMDDMIRDRDQALAAQATTLDERWSIMQSMERMIRDRDQALASQAAMLEQRWEMIQHLEKSLRDREQLIAEWKRSPPAGRP